MPQGWIASKMRMSREGLEGAEGRGSAKGGEEVDQPGLMDSHPMGRSMMVPKPPQEMDPTTASINLKLVSVTFVKECWRKGVLSPHTLE